MTLRNLSQLDLKRQQYRAILKPLALRYRAVRRLIARGYPKEKVAYFVGIKRVAQGWE